MSDAALPRPGLVLGHYPEADDERLSGLDRAMLVTSGWLKQRLLRGTVRAPGFVGRVSRVEKRLSNMDADARAADLAELRHALRRAETLENKLIARAFAHIRLTANEILGIRPYPVQLIGGLVMMKGRVAEMNTGEGKTLTATLPAATAALGGTPVHIVTVNDFLAARDAEWMGPVYRALGLSVGVILEDMDEHQRRAAYACDVVFGTNKQIAFDYLKDRVALGDETRPLHLALQPMTEAQPRVGKVMMRGLCFAIVDEADSCLVDEARTPLIISRKGDTAEMEQTYARAIDLGRALDQPRDMVIDMRERRIRFTDLGKARTKRLSETWGGVWAAEIHREELAKQAISALHLYERDKHYIVREDSIAIVDEYTGRIMADRSWERGLHQMIEVKEGLPITGAHETLARISYQRFFSRYLHLAGMTGTAREVAGELWSVYGLPVQRIAPNRRSRRVTWPAQVYATEAAKWRAVVRRTAKLHAKGRPVLIGTRSVAASETVSRLLEEKALKHALLNARQNEEESIVVSQAGQRGAITVATNMAGRGTDIELGPGVNELGGLFVIATEPHDARRIDRQLSGRAARQGDRGGYVLIASLEDELVEQAFGTWPVRIGRVLGVVRGRVPRVLFAPVLRAAQSAAERRNATARRALLKYDDSMEDMLAFSGRIE